MEKEIKLLCKAMSEILDNQIQIMKNIGLIQNSYEWGDGCDSIRELSSELYRIGNRDDDDDEY